MLWNLLIGAIVGYIASRIMKVNTQWWLNIVLGILGGAVGGWLGGLIGVGGGILGFIMAIVGACLIVWLYKKFAK